MSQPAPETTSQLVFENVNRLGGRMVRRLDGRVDGRLGDRAVERSAGQPVGRTGRSGGCVLMLRGGRADGWSSGRTVGWTGSRADGRLGGDNIGGPNALNNKTVVTNN